MRVHYTTPKGNLRFEIEAGNPKEAVEKLATVQEIFEVDHCGLCQSRNVSFDHREFDGNDYFKYLCRDCRATLDLGQRKDGVNLFLKRKDADGNWLPNHGWYRYGESHDDHHDHGPERQQHPPERSQEGDPRHRLRLGLETLGARGDKQRAAMVAFISEGRWQHESAVVEADGVEEFARMAGVWLGRLKTQLAAELGRKPTNDEIQARLRREADVHKLPA